MTRTLYMVYTVGLVAGLLLPGAASAQSPAPASADTYFHEAAQAYVAGNTAAAQRAVAAGLRVAPADPRLRALREKLRQGGRPQTGQDSSATQQGRRSGANSDPASGGGADESSSPSSADDQGGSQPDPRRGNESPGESSQSGTSSSASATADSTARRPPRDRPGAGRPADTLSREQAERLLRALEGQERQLLRRLRTRSAERRTVEKDW
jgi:hypothetical protein